MDQNKSDKQIKSKYLNYKATVQQLSHVQKLNKNTKTKKYIESFMFNYFKLSIKTKSKYKTFFHSNKK